MNPESEPPDVAFRHDPSGREYQVQRQHGKLWHAEILNLETESAPAGRNDFKKPTVREPVKYLVGSGRHSRTYLTEPDGFLMESPITYYQSTQKWGMSPGYDHPDHDGFERAADFGCLICHVGQAEPIDGALHRLSISETAIGCERCHGPGDQHVAKWTSKPHSKLDGEKDTSIVHPGLLGRDLNEAICAQCHLRGDATVVRAGKSFKDFQPGVLLTDVRIDYRLETDSGTMKVVGHVDQLHASRCYQQSQAMTCTTCHDMHAKESSLPNESTYRQMCLECHSIDNCGLPPADRLLQEPADNCMNCHMPQVETDIPHIAFTHHRIGIHKATTSAPIVNPVAWQLVPDGDISQVTVAEQRRCLGLAYTELADKQANPDFALDYRTRAMQLLRAIEGTQEFQEDGDLFGALARFAWDEQKPLVALKYASRAMNSTFISDGARVNSLLIAGDSYLQLRESENAIAQLERLVKLRRRSQDWLLLGIARYQCGQKATGIEAVRHAVEIQPFRADLHMTLSDMFKDSGKNDESDVHRRLAASLNAQP
ncbi:MAG: hypothetical protein O2856_01300 [Planctomycetota bacterium]|nr:hypothetical protein [Planctomycetota bacterium]